MTRPTTIPDEIPLAGFVLKRYTATDVAALSEAIMASLGELMPWMPWAGKEPLTPEQRLALIERWDADWNAGSSFNFGLCIGDSVVGACALNDRIGTGSLEIGYWVRTGYTGRGYATEAARALTTAAFTLSRIERVEIHHDLANIASSRIPEKLNFSQLGEYPDEVAAPGEVGIEIRWRMNRESWPSA